MNQIYNFFSGTNEPAGKSGDESYTVPEGKEWFSRAKLCLALLLVSCFWATGAFAQTTYYSKAGATDFNSVASWGTATDGTGASPATISNADNFVVVNSAALTLSGNASVRQLTVTSGSLTVGGNILTVGIAGQKNSVLLINGGAFTVSGGTVNIDGYLSYTSGNFNQSGGQIIIDPNNAGATATSTTATQYTLNITAANAVNWTGGSITILDPPASTSSSHYSVYYNTSATAEVSANHTIKFGNGTSADAGGNAIGFYIYNYVGSGKLNWGNFEVYGPLTGNRKVKLYQYSNGVRGNVTVYNTGELDMNSITMYLGGNLNVNAGATLTASGTMYMAPGAGTSFVVGTTPSAITIDAGATVRNSATTQTANFTSLTVNHTLAGGVTINGTSPVTGQPAGSLSISGTLTFVAGKITATNNMPVVLGTPTPATGTFSYTSGGFTSGTTFGRWFTAAGTGTSIATGEATTATSRFAFVSANGLDRSAWIERVTPATAAGVIALKYTETAGYSTVSLTDGAVTLDARANDTWSVSALTGTPLSAASFKVQLRAPGVFGAALNAATARVVQGSTFVGTHQDGSATPAAQRIGLTAAELTAAPFQIIANSNDIGFVSVASGNWNSPSTWSKGTVPTCSDSVIIDTNHTVTVNSAGNLAKNITINALGNLTVVSGDLNITCGAYNGYLVNNGTLNVTGGTLVINGNLSNSALSTFNQSGGDIVVDGNDGGATATSVASGTPLVSLLSNLINWTGGTLTITDPHAATTATNALTYNNSANVNASAAHTLRLGDGSSTDAGGNATAGFRLNTFASSGRITFGNVQVSNLTGTNRFINTVYSYGINGNLTIDADSEFRDAGTTIYVTGNVVNNGTYVNTGILSFTTFLNGTSGAVPTAQSVSGTGVFANATTSPTANLTSLTVNNASTQGVTLNMPLTLSSTGVLTLTAGKLNTSSDNLLTLNNTGAGAVSGASATSYVAGPLARTIASGNAATNFILFPVGKTAYAPISLSPLTTAAAVIKAETFDTNTGTADVSIMNLAANRRWETSVISGAFTSTNVRLGDANLVTGNIPVLAPSATGAYAATMGSTAVFAAGTPNTITGNAAIPAADFTGFVSYAVSNACTGTPAPGNTIASANNICAGTSVTLSAQNTTSGSGVTYQWQSSVNGTTFTDITGANGATYTTTPSEALYYQVKVTCAAGPATTTSTPVQVNFASAVTATTPAARCGVGTLTLGATASAGASVVWFDALTGGSQVGSGTSFTTPSISATTTYYAASQTTAPGMATVGNGTTLTSATSQPTAFMNRWPNYWSQNIFTAAELQAAGLSAGPITSIAYNITTLGDAATNDNFTVRIAPTTASNFANTTFVTTGFSTVYGPQTYTHTASGWQTITFDTPYVWDGTSNIIVEVKMDGADNVNNSQTYYTATTDNKVLYTTSYSGTTTTGTTSTTRINTMFGGTAACVSGRTPVVATVTAPPALTLSTSAVTICAGQASPAVTVTAGASDYDTWVWAPATGVSGTAATGFTFNPSATTTYTLTASQSAGSQCVASATVVVTVNSVPNPITIAAVPATICTNTVQALTVSGSSANGSAALGNGTTAPSTTSHPNPFNAWYGGHWTQMLYKKSELLAMGLVAGAPINSVAFDFAASGNKTLNDLTIRMGNTSVEAMTSGFIAPSSLTTVYNNTYTPTNGATGLVSFTLTTPFVWDGNSNIVLEVVHNAGNSGNGAATTTKTTTTTFDSVYYMVKDGTTPAGVASLQALDLSTITTKGALTARPNVVFNFNFNNPVTWSPVTNLYTDAGGTVPYVAGSPASTVYVKSATAVAATTYTATATNASNCTSVQTVQIAVENCAIDWANLQFPATININTCGSETIYAQVYKAGVTEAAGAGAGITAWVGFSATNSDPATWSESDWKPATFNVQVGNNDEYKYVVANMPAGTYYYASRFRYNTGDYYYGGLTGQWTAPANNGVLTVEAVAAPVASAQTVCSGATVANLTATGTGLKWYADNTTTTALATTEVLTAGTYYVSQTVNACESARTAVVVTVSSVTAPTTTLVQPTCAVATGTITVTAPVGADYTYSIDGTTFQASPAFNAVAAGTYTVTVKNASNCTATASVTINAQPASPVTPMASVTQPTCAVATGTITVTSPVGTGLTYSIDGTNFQSSATFTGVASGSYTVTVQNAAGCTATSVAVTVNAQPATPTDPVSSVTQPTCATATGTITVTAPVGADYTYSIDGTNFQASASFTGVAAGTYSLTVRNTAGCTASANVTVNAQPASPVTPTASVTQPTCAVATGTITVTSPVGAGLTYSIDGTNFQSSATFTGVASGSYTVTVQNAAGCTATSVAVTVNAQPATPTDPVSSVTQPTCATATGTITVTAPVGADYTYSIDGTNFQASASFTGVAAGTYSLTVRNTAGCTAAANVTVNAQPASPVTPMASVTQPTCAVATGTITVTSPVGAGLTYSIDGTNFQSSATFTGVASGSYTVTVQNAAGCTATSVAVTVSAAPSVPAAPTGNSVQTVTVDTADQATIEDLTVTASGTVVWYPTENDAIAGTNAIAAGTQLVNGNTYYAVATNGTCSSTPFAVTVSVVLGRDNFGMGDIKFYPNPVVSKLTISNSSNITAVEVYNLVGQRVIYVQPNSLNAVIDMSALQNAPYIVKVFAGDKSKDIKVIKN